MGSIAVDKAIAKLGTPAEFYQQLEPDKIAEHIVTVFRPRSRSSSTRSCARAPELWRDLPPPVREAMVERVQAQLPAIVGRVTDEIGNHIDQLLDPKIMVIDHFRKNPALVVRIFRDFGQRELNLMVAFGFVFGFLLGIPVAFIDHAFGQWWLLPCSAWSSAGHERARHVADLRAARAAGSSASRCTGCSCAARTRPPRSTPGSSPTT
jgi:hypothetical protein